MTNGFKCARSSCNDTIKGINLYHRRSKSYHYNENDFAITVFHGTKKPLLKAFCMLLRISAKEKGMSSVEMGHEIGVPQKDSLTFLT